MPFPFTVKFLILAMGFLQLPNIETFNTTNLTSLNDDSFAKHPEPHSEGNTEVQRAKQTELVQNRSVTEEDIRRGEFCVKMKALKTGDKLTKRQTSALGCLFEYVMVSSNPDAVRLLNCLSQAGMYFKYIASPKEGGYTYSVDRNWPYFKPVDCRIESDFCS